jgi:hypothetical protein
MDYFWPICIGLGVMALIVFYLLMRKPRKVTVDQKAIDQARMAANEDQMSLDEYVNRELSSVEVGTRYERYIGYLHEANGYKVEYHGVKNRLEDLGRDLIAIKNDQVLIIQTKCWAKTKSIREKHIFQLYGTKVHYELTSNLKTKAIIYNSYSSFSGRAVEVASDLKVELKTKKLDNFYPKVKCKVSDTGVKTYHLPFHDGYDELSISTKKGEFFARTVIEAFEKGHFRPATEKIAA